MTASAPFFPEKETLASAFFKEAARHLADARILHQQRPPRVPASVTSSMKAAELGIKSVLILNNAVGYYDRVFTTHRPLTDARAHPILKSVAEALENQRKGFYADIEEMERLEPNLFGKKGFGPEEANTEYPFLLKTTRSTGGDIALTYSPETYFVPADSEKFYCIARELLITLPLLYPTMKSWQIPLPRSL